MTPRGVLKEIDRRHFRIGNANAIRNKSLRNKFGVKLQEYWKKPNTNVKFNVTIKTFRDLNKNESVLIMLADKGNIDRVESN